MNDDRFRPPFFQIGYFVCLFDFGSNFESDFESNFESDFETDFETDFESDFGANFGSDNLISFRYSVAAFNANLFRLFYTM